jgi:hemerythrin superfamily protein
LSESAKNTFGTLNAVDMLISQHRETQSFVSKISHTRDPQSRHRLLESMCDAVIGHMHIEEEIFYPAAFSGQQREHSVEEHREVKLLMTELLQLNPLDSIFDAKFQQLSNSLLTHIQEEEEQFFPQVRQRLDDKRLKELGKEMHKRFGEITGKSHPRYLAFEDVGKPVPTKETKQPAAKS